LYFQLPYLLEETSLQQAGSFAVEGTSQAILGSFDQRKVPASLSLFLKSEKIPATGPQEEISNHERACTQALRLYKTLSFIQK
jgi:hypothetical protein